MNNAERLIERYGSKKKAADALGKTTETLRLWSRDGIPLESSLEVEEKSAGFVTAEDILREAKAKQAAAKRLRRGAANGPRRAVA